MKETNGPYLLWSFLTEKKGNLYKGDQLSQPELLLLASQSYACPGGGDPEGEKNGPHPEIIVKDDAVPPSQRDNQVLFI